MRIGVVCEGPTDYLAITHFLGTALSEKHIDPTFIQLFPDLDRTRPEGGWPNVLLWLDRNPPAARIQSLFGGGLFSGALSTEPLNAILIQLDTDILGCDDFSNYVQKLYGYEVTNFEEPSERASEVRQVLMLAAKFEDMSNADQVKHVIGPAVEATEAWCVAAFHPVDQNAELLRGNDLMNAFMNVLERSEGREPQDTYANIDKSVRRRKIFCERHKGGSGRIYRSCTQFATAVDDLCGLAP